MVDILTAIKSYTKKNIKSKSFTFESVYAEVTKELGWSPKERDEKIGIVYSDFQLDDEFIYIGNKKWKLRQYSSLSEVSGSNTALYDLNTSPDNEKEDTTLITPEEEEEEEEEEEKADDSTKAIKLDISEDE